MLFMTEEEARTIMHVHGWFYSERRPKRVARYVYARRRQGPRMIDRYICPFSRLGDLTEQELIAKLTTGPAKN
jgi:hypothetical protein